MLNRMMSDVPWYVIMFWHSAIGLCTASIIVTGIALFSGENSFFSYTGRQYGLLTLCGFLDFIGLSCMTIAFQACELGFIGLFGYLIVVYSFLADIFVFHETFKTLELLGCLLIACVTLGVGLYKYWLERREQSGFVKQ
jgi:drug/metabolite transporter (DMT)-like permease